MSNVAEQLHNTRKIFDIPRNLQYFLLAFHKGLNSHEPVSLAHSLIQPDE
jgi:hypothetical protein